MSKTLQSGRAVDLKKSTQVLEAPYGEAFQAYRGAIGVLSVGNGAIVGECRRIRSCRRGDLVVVDVVRYGSS